MQDTLLERVIKLKKPAAKVDYRQLMREKYNAVQLSTPDERWDDYYSAFLAVEIARENDERAILREARQRVASAAIAGQEQSGLGSQVTAQEATVPDALAPLDIDPDKLYSRQMLLRLGMPRRMINSISKVRFRRGWYRGRDVLAALSVRTVEQQRAKDARHPVQFRSARRAS